DVVVVGPDDQLLMATAGGKAIRFAESDARSMGRNTSGVKGVRLRKGDQVVGMVVANPEATLLTVCEQGYGKRTWFGAGETLAPTNEAQGGENGEEAEVVDSENGEAAEEPTSGQSYRTQRRGGGGLIDIKASKRNGPVIGIVPVTDEDELLMMTSRGKIQRVAAREISIIGRNTQGVRIMNVDEGDTLTAIVKVPKEDALEEEIAPRAATPPGDPAAGASPQGSSPQGAGGESQASAPESDDELQSGGEPEANDSPDADNPPESGSDNGQA
ncbi:MAG: DNA gyrase subunit A, partial [Planctomycetales bacterium]|nr:DNA gyrase subunit A [Planctomycetales bacterium]